MDEHSLSNITKLKGNTALFTKIYGLKKIIPTFYP